MSSNPFTQCVPMAPPALRVVETSTLRLKVLEEQVAESERIVTAARLYCEALVTAKSDQAKLARALVSLRAAVGNEPCEAGETPEEIERLRDVDAAAGEMIDAFRRAEREDIEHATESRVLTALRPAARDLERARAVFVPESGVAGGMPKDRIEQLTIEWAELGRSLKAKATAEPHE